MNGLAICACLLVAASAMPAQAPHVDRLKRGDTTIVRTTGSGLWGAPHDAVEIKRIGGGSNETTFGDLMMPSALPNGGVLVFDRKALDGPALRMFDRDGKFIRNVGRVGNGPGEFEASGPAQLVVAPNGSFVIRRSDGLVNRYRADGTFINAFRFELDGGGRLDTYAGLGNSIYIRGGQRNGIDMAYIGVRRYDTLGKMLDSLMPIPYLAEPPASNYDPLEWWFPLPDGRIVATRTDRLGFLLRSGPDHKALFLADLAAQGPLYVPEERAEMQAAADMNYDFLARYGRAPGARPVVPERKQLYSRTDAAIDGNIWGTRRTTSVKGETRRTSVYKLPDGTMKYATSSYSEPTIYSGFRLDGIWLGDITFPAGVQGVSFNGDFAWAIVIDKDGTPSLVKYRLH